MDDPLSAKFTPEKIWQRLQRSKNRTLYVGVYNRYDRGGHICTAVFNAVRKLQHVPRSWDESSTILIPKNGDPRNVNNWRPIALSNTLGKLYASVISSRFSKWCIKNDRISPSQKGFIQSTTSRCSQLSRTQEGSRNKPP
ncbi:uncharacterized protein LOC113383706 [Ctenocephalides felis]|uniref:uncharacterized protein LOC113383706 n=1 Tax=Ctenocephalides felis TaxID=7515 RepID=UPI000E6E163A|nr:uncharacterized protein LOC113383706 [Ctenocephalides felis]